MAPLLLSVPEAARVLSCGRTNVYHMISTGQLESVKLGGLRRIPAAAVEAYVARLRAVARVEEITDPCATGCPDPARHAEGGHDV
jgi:excisionase family DNA binding protein